MKKNPLLTSLLLLLFIIHSSCFAQKDTSKVESPRNTVTEEVGHTLVSINYGQPSVKNREIWGKLVPYGEIWRTGANDATVLTLTEDMIIEGNEISSGKYAFFTIPGKEKWTLILNKDHDQCGANNYDRKKDVLRVEVSPKKIDHKVEKLTFYIEPTGKAGLEWNHLRVPFTIKEPQNTSP